MTVPTSVLTVEARNTADAAEAQLAKTSGNPIPLGAAQLLTKLRYQDPESPTRVESLFIPAMRAAFLDLGNDFSSYQQKPSGCGCAGKLQAIISQRAEITQGVLDSVFGAGVYKFISAIPQMPSQFSRAGTLAGVSAVIDATPAAWTAYFADLRKGYGPGAGAAFTHLYHGVHVKDTADGKWLLLFY